MHAVFIRMSLINRTPKMSGIQKYSSRKKKEIYMAYRTTTLIEMTLADLERNSNCLKLFKMPQLSIKILYPTCIISLAVSDVSPYFKCSIAFCQLENKRIYVICSISFYQD